MTATLKVLLGNLSVRQSSPNDERHAGSVEANDIGAGDRRGRCRATVVVAALICLCGFAATAASAGAETATYSTFSAIQTVPVPPASHFAGSGGGDGWAVALSEKAVYNVFHHQGTLQVACHLQSNAEPCFSPETITDAEGHGFASSGQPGMYLDQHTEKLYVYATRTSDDTPGVVCIDTTLAPTNPDPFCGFTALTAVGEASFGGYSAVSAPMLIGSHWYAFNYVNGVGQEGGKNMLMCFDVSTDEACSGQPYAVSLGAGTVSSGLPSPATAAIGSQVIIPIRAGGSEELACFDDSTQSNCAGSWPVSLGFSYVGQHGSPFPLLDPTGKIIGLCLSTGTDQCFTLAGASTPTPAGMTGVLGASDPWNGPALVLGPRVYVPNGEGSQSGEVECFDYSTGVGCANFPKMFTELGYLYTVNADPQRPTCIWVNSDDGTQQIQDFDAYTGEACGGGTVRVLASQFVAPAPQCTPANYVSLQVLQPPRSSYSTGSVAFANGDGELIPGMPEIALDETGSASLNGLDLNTTTGLPQFLFTLQNPTGPVGSVEVRLTWEGNYDESCAGEGRTVVRPPAPPATPAAAVAPAKVTVTPAPAPKPVAGVLASGNAHIASHTPACIASAGYLAAVGGKGIASVTFTLDGHKLATVSKPSSHGVFATRVRVSAGGKHKLIMHVTFTAASHTAAENISRTLARCAVFHPKPTPSFTG
jgi:hypothetical protein